MATEGSPSLPVIVVDKPGVHSEQKAVGEVDTDRTTSAAPHVHWGPVTNHVSSPRPGDVFRSRRGVRPLGLLPDRRRLDTWKQLKMLLSKPTSSVSSQAPPPTAEKVRAEESNLGAEIETKPTIAATVSCSLNRMTIPQGNLSSGVTRSGYRVSRDTEHEFDCRERHHEDREYLETLAHARSHMEKYYGQPNGPQYAHQPSRVPEIRTRVSGLSPSQVAVLRRLQPSAKIRRPYGSVSDNMEYLSISEQAQLYRKQWFTDCRDGSAYEPCERCRLRGTRCSKCKAIRTGGGYIILDGLTSLSDFLANQRNTTSFVNVSKHGRGQHGRRLSGIDGTSSGLHDQWGHDGNFSNEGSSNILDGSSSRTGSGLRRDWYGHQGGTGDGGRGIGGGSDSNRSSNRVGSAQSKRPGTGLDASHRRSGLFNLKEDEEDSNAYGQHHGRLSEDHDGGERDGEEKGELRRSSIRPRTGRRPPSSLRRDRRKGGESVFDFDRRGRDINFEGGDKRRRRKQKGDESDSDDGSGDESKRRRRRHTSGGDGDDDDGRKDKEIHNLKGQYNHDNNDRGSQIHLGDLRRFKSKRDDVKAIACTLKQLQGIDPLDYLAKYCIIDQSKLPEYQRVFDNVDRDEDDEITIPELDFALKAVNYNLISDAEMTYVHSILELAGRYALNFRLFSLVAALSEKVVALEDMVKRLINSMDFEALEVKMKKCKELFYLLADSSDDGVVTTSALAVELQAGGLTEEHVEFVVDRLNHQGKGVVEFLDYLTYVPLFVEIHDSISDNPLDFTRTK